MTGIRLGRRGVNRLLKLLALPETLRHGIPVDSAMLPVLHPGRPRDIAPDDAFHRDALDLLANHRATADIGRVGEATLRGQVGIEAVDIVHRLRHVVGDDFRGAAEPEGREAVEDMALERDANGQYHIKGGNAVAGDDEQVAPEVVRITHLAPDKYRQRQVRFHQH